MSNLATIKSDTTALAAAADDNAKILENVMIGGNLAQMKPIERVQYYKAVCESTGLNPMTRPLEYIELDGKLTLYTRKDATDQLRRLNKVSITKIETEITDGLIVVTVYGEDKDGRSDAEMGAVPLEAEEGEWKTAQSGKRYFQGTGRFSKLRGDKLANARMKAITKAKRRLTLSLCGLGWLDESELDTVPTARRVTVTETGEIDDQAYATLIVYDAANTNGIVWIYEGGEDRLKIKAVVD